MEEALSEALSEAGVNSAHGSAATSPHTPGSLPSVPGSPNFGGADACLSDLEAGQAASAIGEMSDVNLNLEPIQEIVEQLGPRDEQGGCSST